MCPLFYFSGMLFENAAKQIAIPIGLLYGIKSQTEIKKQKMKNLLLIAILVFSVVATNAQEEKKSRKQKKAERQAQLEEQTKKLLEEEAWQFDASTMLPGKGSSQTLTTPYNVVLKDGKVDSYLPYRGRAYSAEYGGSSSPMVFESPIEDYSVEEGKKGKVIIKFTARNKNDVIVFTFTVTPDGSTSLSVSSTNRQHISYQGDLVPIEQPKEKKDKKKDKEK